MKKRFHYLILFLILFLIVFLLRSCTNYKKTIECSISVEQEVFLVAEFGVVRDFEYNDIGIGVITFKNGDILYGVGHSISFEDINNLSVYEVSPFFERPTEDSLGGVLYNKNRCEDLLIGTVIQNSDNGIIIYSEEIITEKYQSVGIANKISSGNAELLMRDEKGKLQSYSISILIVEENGKERLEIFLKDEELLSKTGGIIPGMSGCPIIQNDKLVGILTETYINNQRRGKGKIIWNIDCIKNYMDSN